MSGNIEIAINKDDVTIDEIKTIVSTLVNNGFGIQQFNVTKHIAP